MNFEQQKAGAKPIRALCIARHCFLSEHIARYFADIGVVTDEAVGLSSAAQVAAQTPPDVVICDYDLLSAISFDKWEKNELLSTTPVVAVSLTRRSQELSLLDVDGIAGFLYLPTLEPAPALQILRAATSRPKYSLPFGAQTRTAEPS
jgi:DNA-binding NarL/FixJ family response regulator